MCGILGIIDKKPIDFNLLLNMRDVLTHRGPDDGGMWLRMDKRVGLAHRRLSIIDLSPAGHQPMSDEEGKVWITYNGEIYNFKEIRKELEAKGYNFKSHTDTEVIINTYKEWGIEGIQKFNGMFAFGIYDLRFNHLLLARDRVGKKPLYYAKYNGKLVFASELKAILCDYEFPKEIDYRALNFYLTLGYIPFDFTIFKHARKLLPAHAMHYSLERDKCQIIPYWGIPPLDETKHEEEELLEELDHLLEDAVRLRLVSDVPLGAFLSGGVDSSLVVAMMTRVSDRPVKTFSIGFEEKRYNELPYARVIADYFGTEHTELIVRPDAFTMLTELVKQTDEPFADSSMIPTYYVSKLTRHYVTVALSGDGGDELFGGYSNYLGAVGNYYAARILPQFVRSSLAAGAQLLPEMVKGKRQILRLAYDPYRAFVDRVSNATFKHGHRQKILKPEIVNSLAENFNEPEGTLYNILISRKTDFVNSLAFSDFQTYLPEDILTKVDRTSMKVSLEVRCPLLDHRIVEFAFKKLRGDLKIRFLTKKYLLKKLAKRILPPDLNIRRKQGFSIPLSEWFRNGPSGNLKDILFSINEDIFNRSAVQKLVAEHARGIDHGTRLFTLLVFALWEEQMKKS